MADKTYNSHYTTRKGGRPKTKTKEIAKRPSTNPRGSLGLSQTSPEELTALINHMQDLWTLDPVDIEDPQAVAERIQLFFEICAKNGKRPTVSSLCLAIGITETTFKNWYHGVYRASTHQAVALKAKMILESMWEDWMVEGKINPVAGIFLAKNHFEYKNETDIVHTTKRSLGDDKTEEDLRQKYMDSIDVEYTEVE